VNSRRVATQPGRAGAHVSGAAASPVGTLTEVAPAGERAAPAPPRAKWRPQAPPEPEVRTLRVALIQSRSAVGTETFDPRDENLNRALKAIDSAADDGAKLVVFGELYLSGYRTDEWLHKWATTVDPPDRHLMALLDIARARDVHVIMGAGTFGRFMPGDVYNAAIFVGPTGMIGVYRKCHVAAFPYSEGVSMERCFYSPGKELPVFDTQLGRIGIHICYDIAMPEVARVQALRGAEVLINVSASAAGFEDYWNHCLFMRAVENTTWYMVCSVVGEQRGDVLFGGSRVVDPSGRVVAAGKYHEEDVVVADIDVDLARRSRASFHTFNLRQPELYAPISEPTPHP
jgi:predicted amidohydrolase